MNHWDRSKRASIRAILMAGCALAFTVAGMGCGGGSALAPVEDGAARALREPSGEVVPGDTLYAFAWRYGFDYREVAAWNNLQPPYRLRPGQRLRLMPQSAPTAVAGLAPVAEIQVRAAAAAKAVEVRKMQPAATPSRPPSIANDSAVPQSDSPAPSRSTVPPPPTPQTSSAQEASSLAATSVVAWTPPKTAPASWRWPVEGARVVGSYDASRPGGRGLNLEAQPGSRVRAAAGGRVVYEGSGLPGYGRLIILKHTDSLLSAYGHLGGFHVKEGDVVEPGQVLADLSNGGSSNAPVLRFEIREDGQPKNPLAYLPG